MGVPIRLGPYYANDTYLGYTVPAGKVLIVKEMILTNLTGNNAFVNVSQSGVSWIFRNHYLPYYAGSFYSYQKQVRAQGGVNADAKPGVFQSNQDNLHWSTNSQGKDVVRSFNGQRTYATGRTSMNMVVTAGTTLNFYGNTNYLVCWFNGILEDV